MFERTPCGMYVDTVCEPCPVGSYCVAGATAPVDCPEGSDTRGKNGSASIDDCECVAEGFVLGFMDGDGGVVQNNNNTRSSIMGCVELSCSATETPETPVREGNECVSCPVGSSPLSGSVGRYASCDCEWGMYKAAVSN
eukprot:2698659-Rhodomonas_salina.1